MYLPLKNGEGILNVLKINGILSNGTTLVLSKWFLDEEDVLAVKNAPYSCRMSKSVSRIQFVGLKMLVTPASQESDTSIIFHIAIITYLFLKYFYLLKLLNNKNWKEQKFIINHYLPRSSIWSLNNTYLV